MALNPQYATLVPNVVTSLDFTDAVGPVPATVKVTTDGAVAQKLYFTGDGSTPAADGAGSWCLLGGQPGWKAIALTHLQGRKLVKLLSPAAAWVCVETYPD